MKSKLIKIAIIAVVVGIAAVASRYIIEPPGRSHDVRLVVEGSHSGYKLTPFKLEEIANFSNSNRLSGDTGDGDVIDILKYYKAYFETGKFPSDVSIQGVPSIRLNLPLDSGMDYYFMKPSSYRGNDSEWISLMLIGVPEGSGTPIYAVHQWTRVDDRWQVGCVW